MTREVMLDALEHDYNDLMNLGDIYGARGVEAAIDTLRLYEKSSSSPAKNVRKRALKSAASKRSRGDDPDRSSPLAYAKTWPRAKGASLAFSSARDMIISYNYPRFLQKRCLP